LVKYKLSLIRIGSPYTADQSPKGFIHPPGYSCPQIRKRGKEEEMWNWNNYDEPSPQPARQPAEGHTSSKHNTDIIRREKMGQVAIIGQSIQIKGELTGNEDLTIDGTVEGNIQLKDNSLTIGPNGNIKADINAKKVTIIGEVQGNVTAEETVEIRESGKLRGNITTPRLIIADGAFFKGSVEMERKPGMVKDKVVREDKSALRPELMSVKQ